MKYDAALLTAEEIEFFIMQHYLGCHNIKAPSANAKPQYNQSVLQIF